MKEIKIVSFNVRLCAADDGINSFVHRSGTMLSKIKSEQPEIIGFQEVMAECADFLIENLPEYHFVFNRRNEDLTGEGLMLAVKKSNFYVISTDYFWMSETPRVAGSRFEDQSNCPRVTQCITVQDKATSKVFRVYNTHLDHISDFARIQGIECLLEYAKLQEKIMSAPMFLMGDFNALPNSETIQFCNNFEDIPLTDLTADIPVSFHKFGERLPNNGIKIDYIYADSETAKNYVSATVWKDEAHGIYLSDHYPVVVKIKI